MKYLYSDAGSRNKRSSILLVILVTVGSFCVQAAEESSYPKTIQALKQRYADEMVAHQKYGAYARQADKEEYPYVAHLFRSLAASEIVHGRNFKRLLEDLGVQPPPIQKLDLKVKKTKKNIHHATAVEAEEIDKQYPAILKDIGPEKHQAAIQSITYAWKAEEQHRDLILKIKKASKRFFGILVSHIEGEPTRYHVCQICGSTLTAVPADLCPICVHPASNYVEVPGFPGLKALPDNDDDSD